MFSMPKMSVTRKILEAKLRTGNLPPEDAKAEMGAVMDAEWERVMRKAENYVQGADVLGKGGHFSAASTGNWFLIADAAGVDRIPGNVVSVVSPVMIMAAHSELRSGDEDRVNAFFERYGEDFSRFVNDIQRVGPNEIIRFDAGADGRLKAEMAMGRADGTAPQFRGYRESKGTKFPEFDERIVRLLMENPENDSPVWSREWVPPRMARGDRGNGFSYVVSSETARRAADPMTPESGAVRVDAHRADYGDAPSEGDLFPLEWRVFVKNGEIAAVGNYYTQISRAMTPEDETDAACAVAEIMAKAQRMIDAVREAGAVAHHPQYEDHLRKDVDPDGGHFTIDFMETEDASAPFGRRLVMVDAGVGHLRNPPFGAHPVSFGGDKDPEGVAFGLGDVRTFDEVLAIARRAERAPEP